MQKFFVKWKTMLYESKLSLIYCPYLFNQYLNQGEMILYLLSDWQVLQNFWT